MADKVDKVYVTRCIVKRNDTQYKKGQVIKDLSEKEIEQGLKESWLKELGDGDDDDTGSKPKKPNNKKSLEKMTFEELLAKATELGIPADNTMKADDLIKKIKEKEAQK